MWKNKRKKQINKGRICKAPGCNFHAFAKGYCCNHYGKYYKKEKGKNER